MLKWANFRNLSCDKTEKKIKVLFSWKEFVLRRKKKAEMVSVRLILEKVDDYQLVLSGSLQKFTWVCE